MCLSRRFLYVSILMSSPDLKINTKSILTLHAAEICIKEKNNENGTTNLRNNKRTAKRKQNYIHPRRKKQCEDTELL